jgi:hypothetical protein
VVVNHKYPITFARRSSSFASLAAPAKCGNKIAMGADVTAGAFRLGAVRSRLLFRSRWRADDA